MTVALLMQGTSAAAQDLSPTLDAIAARARESRQWPGVSVAVQLGDRRLLDKGYGEADVENHAAATAETMYHILCGA